MSFVIITTKMNNLCEIVRISSFNWVVEQKCVLSVHSDLWRPKCNQSTLKWTFMPNPHGLTTREHNKMSPKWTQSINTFRTKWPRLCFFLALKKCLFSHLSLRIYLYWSWTHLRVWWSFLPLWIPQPCWPGSLWCRSPGSAARPGLQEENKIK